MMDKLSSGRIGNEAWDAVRGVPAHWLPIKEILRTRSAAPITLDDGYKRFVERIRFFVCNWNIGAVANEYTPQCPAEIAVCATHIETGEQRFYCKEHGVLAFEWSLEYHCYLRKFHFRFTPSP